MTNTIIQEWTDEKGWIHRIEIPLATFLIEHDLEPVVRCKDCKHFLNSNEKCGLVDKRVWSADCFCAWGDKKDE